MSKKPPPSHSEISSVRAPGLPKRVPTRVESAPESILAGAAQTAPTHLEPLASAGPAEPPRPIGVGDTLDGRYRLDGHIGQGGMGAVYRGWHLSLEVPIAVKVMNAEVAARDDSLARFRREAKATSLLDHPNVVRVLDFSASSPPYIVMEFIEGQSLGDYLEELLGPPPLVFVADVLGQICDALTAAHTLKIVHRDLKPDNVLLGKDPQGRLQVKVVDFGLAHLDRSEYEGPTLTQKEFVAGTPQYMSPEQCRSLSVGASTDIYAVGCILTALLQLRPPFTGSSAMEILSQQMLLPPPALERPEGAEPVPPALEQLRLRLLAKLPHERPETAEEAKGLLVGCLDPETAEKLYPSIRAPRSGRGRYSSAPPRPVRHEDVMSVTLIQERTRPGGVESLMLTAFAAHSIEVTLIREAKPPPVDVLTDLVLIDSDASDDVVAGLIASVAESQPGTPVVVCQDAVELSDIRRWIEKGAADVLAYPLAADRLVSRVQRLARRAKRRRGL